jgi:tRNA 2-thiouridine synthesizing protein D
LSALSFAKNLIDQGHSIYRIFFYSDAVFSGTTLGVSPQDEVDIPKEWQQLASDHNIDLVFCISASIQRGIIDQQEAERYEKQAHNLDETAGALSGLGQLVDAIIKSDRVVTF